VGGTPPGDPRGDTTELRAVMTPFYALLRRDARRQQEHRWKRALVGGTAVADGDHSLAAAVRPDARRVAAVFPSGQGTATRAVFEICPPPSGCEHGDTLFSVLTIPPSQGDAKLAALVDASQPPASRWGDGSCCWGRGTVRVGGAAGHGLGSVPARRSDPLPSSLLPRSTDRSRESLAHRRPFLWRGLVAAGGHMVVAAGHAATVVGDGGGGPVASRRAVSRALRRARVAAAGGVSLGLWLSWQAALAATAMALILLAAALVRGSKEPDRSMGAARRLCMGHVGGDWRPPAVESAWRLARVVHIPLATGARGRDSACTAALGARQYGDRCWNGGGTRHVGRGGGRTLVLGDSRRPAAGKRR
jgi:hypothetical protein